MILKNLILILSLTKTKEDIIKIEIQEGQLKTAKNTLSETTKTNQLNNNNHKSKYKNNNNNKTKYNSNKY